MKKIFLYTLLIFSIMVPAASASGYYGYNYDSGYYGSNNYSYNYNYGYSSYPTYSYATYPYYYNYNYNYSYPYSYSYNYSYSYPSRSSYQPCSFYIKPNGTMKYMQFCTGGYRY